MSPRHRLLIIDDEASLVEFLALLFQSEGYDVATAGSVEEARKSFERSSYDLVLCDILKTFGTPDQQQRFLPVLARGEKRGALCLSEADAGSDLQSIRTTATRDGDVYRINGAKMWITNARHAQLFLILTKTDTTVTPAHRGITAFVAEKGAPGLTVGRDIQKLGYRGLETCEVVFDDFVVPRVETRRLRIEKNGGFRALADGWREGRPGDQTSQDTVVRRSAQRFGHCCQAGTVLEHYFSKTARGDPPRCRPRP